MQKAIDLEPNNSIFHTNLSYIYLATRKFGESEDEASKAIALEKGNISAYYIRGSAYTIEGKLERARTDAESMIALDGSDPRGYVLKSSVLMAELSESLVATPGSTIRDKFSFLEQAHETLVVGSERSRTHPNRKILDDELEIIEAFYTVYKKEPRKPTEPPDPNVTPVKILAKPRAQFSDKARVLGVEGTVRVAILLGADGKVRYILFLKRLGAGLDEEVIRAARQIRFEPKRINGQPVAAVVTFEYSFDIR